MTKSPRFQDHLRELVDPIWEAQHNHPFIKGIGEGTLDIELLKFWVRQDYLYLIDYSRILSIASAKAPDVHSLRWFATLAKGVSVEMELHLSYARDFGISEAELVTEVKAPSCQGYTDFLLRTATVDPFEAIVAALLPCFWCYQEIGTRLEDRGLPENELYVRWIKQYTDPEYAKQVRYCRDLIDRLGEEATGNLRNQMEQAFVTSSRYEYLFWEMCYTQETWPV